MNKIDAVMSIVLLFGAAWGVVGAMVPLGLLAGAIRSYNKPDDDSTGLWVVALVISIFVFVIPLWHTVQRCQDLSPIRSTGSIGEALTDTEWTASGCAKFSWLY